MNQEQLTVSLEIAKQLKEAGFPQDTEFEWYTHDYKEDQAWVTNDPGEYATFGDNLIAAAPTAEEVLERIPEQRGRDEALREVKEKREIVEKAAKESNRMQQEMMQEAEKECYFDCPGHRKPISGNDCVCSPDDPSDLATCHRVVSPAPVEWEERFDKQFVEVPHPDIPMWKDEYYHQTLTEQVTQMKSFIRTLLYSEREKVLDEVEEKVIGKDQDPNKLKHSISYFDAISFRNGLRAQQRKALAEMRGKIIC